MSNKNQILVAYEYPTSPAWVDVFVNADRIYGVILNPHNGPGAAQDSNYVNLVTRLKAAGILVYGYIFTGVNQANYGTRPIPTIQSEVLMWNAYYAPDGFFFDEASSAADKIPYYQRLRGIIGTDKKMILNHGTVPAPEYGQLDAVLCIAETSQRTFNAINFPGWVKNYPASKFLAIVYGVDDPVEVASKVFEDNISYIYMTALIGPNPQYDLEHTIYIPGTPVVIPPTTSTGSPIGDLSFAMLTLTSLAKKLRLPPDQHLDTLLAHADVLMADYDRLRALPGTISSASIDQLLDEIRRRVTR